MYTLLKYDHFNYEESITCARTIPIFRPIRRAVIFWLGILEKIMMNVF